MAGETQRGGENGNGLAVWKPVQDLLNQLGTTGVSSADLRGNPLQRQLALRQNEAARHAQEQVRSFVPSVDVKYAVDVTGSMSNDRGPVQTDFPIFVNKGIAGAFANIPLQVQQQISPEREINWTRVNFGDGTPYGRGYSFGDNSNMRYDVPYLTVSSGTERLNAQHLEDGVSEATAQFRSYHNHMSGGSNEGESSAEALLALLNLNPQNTLQLGLLQRLLADCRTLQGMGSSFDNTAGFTGARHHRTADAANLGGDIVPYLQRVIAGELIPPILQGAAQNGEGSDMLFLVTDEPAVGSIIKLGEVEEIRARHGFFAIITPREVGAYWRGHVQQLGAQWFDLNDLFKGTVDMSGMNVAQTAMAEAIGKHVRNRVVSDLTKTLQLMDGSRGAGGGVVKV